MNPLAKVDKACRENSIPEKVRSQILQRFPITVAGINRIEKASGIQFPMAYVEPAAIMTAPDPHSYQYGILFARTIPVMHEDKLRIIIQMSAPLIAYGLKGTIHAVLAHEFLHYLDLTKRISRMELLSDEISGNLFENTYTDETRILAPGAVFADKTLLRHITKKFPAGFRDYKLEDKTVKFWIELGLPKIMINLDSNITKITADSLARMNLDAELVRKIEDIEARGARMRRRKLY